MNAREAREGHRVVHGEGFISESRGGTFEKGLGRAMPVELASEVGLIPHDPDVVGFPTPAGHSWAQGRVEEAMHPVGAARPDDALHRPSDGWLGNFSPREEIR